VVVVVVVVAEGGQEAAIVARCCSGSAVVWYSFAVLLPRCVSYRLLLPRVPHQSR